MVDNCLKFEEKERDLSPCVFLKNKKQRKNVTRRERKKSGQNDDQGADLYSYTNRREKS